MSGEPRSPSACAARGATALAHAAKPLASCVAALAVLGLSGAADAQPQQQQQPQLRALAKAKGWTAYAGSSKEGRNLCVMTATGGGRWIGIKYFQGEEKVNIQLSTSSWTVRNGAVVIVTMQFDRESPWNAKAVAFHMDDGDAALQINIDSKDIGQFVKEFYNSYNMYVRFPEEKIDDWKADLKGTPPVTLAWARCLKDIQEVSNQFTWA